MVFALILFASTGPAFADLDVNAVSGVATIGGTAAPAGTTIFVMASGHSTTTKVDGPNVPPFRRGEGRFDTGDVPYFNTGDTVTVSFQNPGIKGQSSKTLQAGTTSVNLNGELDQPPTIQGVPDQSGTEDVSWTLDLDPYISDPDSLKSSLTITVVNSYVSVDDHVLTFLYPDGITSDTVIITVSDSSSSDTDTIEVTIEPVNDPPVLTDIPSASLMEGSGTVVDLSLYVSDPDDGPGSMTWDILESGDLEASLQGSLITINAPEGSLGLTMVELSVSDPGGLTDQGNLQVEVGANITALMDFWGNQIDDLNAQITYLQEENLNLSSNVSFLSSEITRLEGEKSGLRDRLDEAESNADSLLDELDMLRAQGRTQGETISSLEEERTRLEAMITSLTEGTNETIADYLSTIAQLNATCLDYVSQIGDLEATIGELEANITALEADAGQNEDEMAALKKDKEDLQSILDSKELELDGLEALVAGLQTQVRELESQRSQAEETLSEIETALEELRAENAQMQEDLDRMGKLTPASIIGPINTSKENQTIAGNLFGKAARIARDGATLVLNGMDNSLVLLIVAIIAISSGVTIAARTSWLQIGSIGRHNTADEFWRTIESRTINDSQTHSINPLGSHGKKTTSSSTNMSTQGGETKSHRMMVRRKPTPPQNREKRRKVVASNRPISVTKASPKMARALERLVDQPKVEPKSKKKKTGVRKSAGKEITPSKLEPAAKPMQKPSGPTPEMPKPKTPKPALPEKPATEQLDSPGLSNVDREYIKTLIEMGFTKEAEEELRKRSSGNYS